MLFTYESVRNSYVRFDWSIRPIRSQVRRLHVLRLKKKVKFIRGNICLPFANTCVHSLVCGGVRAAPLCSCLCCPIMWLYVRFNFRIETMFNSSLRIVVRRRARALFTLFVCLFVYNGVRHILCFLLSLSSCCVVNVASFSGLSILDCPFNFSNVYLAVNNIFYQYCTIK